MSVERALQLNGGCLGLSDILCDLRGFNGAEDVGVGRGDLGDAGDDVGFDDFEVDGFLCPLGNSLICTKNSLVCVIDSLLAILDDILSRDECNRIVADHRDGCEITVIGTVSARGATETEELVLVILVEDLLIRILTWLFHSATIDVLRDDVASEGELKSQSLVVPVASSLTSVVGHFAGELVDAIRRE